MQKIKPRCSDGHKNDVFSVTVAVSSSYELYDEKPFGGFSTINYHNIISIVSYNILVPKFIYSKFLNKLQSINTLWILFLEIFPNLIFQFKHCHCKDT